MSQKITITIETGNAAFANDAGWETARILRVLADQVEYHGILIGVDGEACKLRDYNGNQVGVVTVEGEASR